MQQFEYDKIFSMSIISSSSGKKTFQDKTGRRLLKVNAGAADDKNGLYSQEDEDEENGAQMKFSARVLSHSSKEIEFELDFENAYMLSKTSEYDLFVLRVNKAYLFRSATMYKTISDDCEKQNCVLNFENKIPP